MNKRRIVIAVFALAGALVGALLAAMVAPQSSRYTASANVALLPGPGLTTVEASDFWEVLTRGQVTRTAAIVYDDSRWLASAAETADVAQQDLTLTAAARPETTMIVVSVTAPSSAAAEAALNDVLTTATPEVSSLAAPYFVKVLWPQQGSAAPVGVPGRLQFAAAGALGGLLVGGSVGWFVMRRRRIGQVAEERANDTAEDEVRLRP